MPSEDESCIMSAKAFKNDRIECYVSCPRPDFMLQLQLKLISLWFILSQGAM